MDAKHQILNAAAILFAQKGYAATSIREIAAMASVNLAMVNYYFKSKEYLLHNIMQECITSIMNEKERLMLKDHTPLEKIDAIVDLYTQYLFLNKEVALIFFQEQMKSSGPDVSQLLQKLTRWNREVFERMIKEGQQQGLFSTSVDTTFLYATLLGTSQQVIIQNGQLAVKSKKGALVAYLKMIA
jgi:AcrR family transcriptional regulator